MKRFAICALFLLLFVIGGRHSFARNLFVATWPSSGGNSAVYRVNSNTGDSILLGFAGATISGLTFDDEGTLFGWGQNGALYTIDQTNGAATIVGPSGFPGVEGAIAFSSSGFLLASDSSTSGDRLLAIDPNDGSGTFVGDFGDDGQDISGLTFVDGTLFGIDGTTDTLVTIDTNTGFATQIGPLGVGVGGSSPTVTGLTFDGSSLLMVDINGIYSVDPMSGSATFRTGMSRVSDPIGGAAYLIPEPASVAIAIAALCLVPSRRRSHRFAVPGAYN